jgi:hypothetical protein
MILNIKNSFQRRSAPESTVGEILLKTKSNGFFKKNSTDFFKSSEETD